MDASTYALPPEMNSIISATIVQTTQTDVIICHDQYFIYAAKVNKNPTVFTFQKFAQASVSAVVPIIKNYFMALSSLKKIMIFEVSFTQEGKILLKYNYNKDKPYSSYFIREVVENMAQLQIFYPENEILIFQFTVNGKVGTMNYSITPQHKLKTCERLQLYGSKTIFSANRKMIYFFTNFSNKTVNYHNLTKYQNDIFDQLRITPMAYVCLPKIQEFYILSTNFTALHVPNFNNRHKIFCENNQHYELIQRLMHQIDNRDNSLTISTYMDLIMIQDIQRQIAYTFQLKLKNSALIGVEHGTMNWFWTCSRKLIGLSPDRSQFKIIQSLKINQSLKLAEDPVQLVRKDYKMKMNEAPKPNQFLSYKQFYEQKMKENQELHNIEIKKLEALNVNNQTTQNKDKTVPPNLWPAKIIQRNKTSTSKTLHKSKEIEPIASNPTSANLSLSPNLQSPDFKQPSKQEPLSQSSFEVIGLVGQQKISTVQTSSSALQYCSGVQERQQDDLLKESNNVIDKSQQEDVGNPTNKSKQTIQVIQEFIEKQIVSLAEPEKLSTNPFIIQLHKKQSIKNPKKIQEKQDQKIAQVSDKVETQSVDKKGENNEQQKGQVGEQHLPRSLAVLVGKSQLGGQYSHTINLFNTSINRNNIFTSVPKQNTNSITSLFPKNQQQGDFYNPLLCYSPCSPGKQQVSDNPTQGQQIEQKVQPSQTLQKEKESLQQLNAIREKQNAMIVEKLKELFHETTSKLLFQLEQLGKINQLQPYIRDHLIDEIKMKVYDNLQRQMTGDFSSRIEKYFVELFRQTSQVQEESVKFYKEANLYKSKNLQIQINNQQKILKDIRQIESHLRMHVVNLKKQNKQSFQNLMRDWQKHFKENSRMVDHLNGVKVKLQEQKDLRVQKEKQIKRKLAQIKKYLANKIIAKQQKQQKRLQKRVTKKIVETKVQKSKKTKGQEDSKLKSKSKSRQAQY